MKPALRNGVSVLFLLLLSATRLPAQTPLPKPPAALADLSNAFQTLTERVSPSVVQVFTSGFDPIVRGEGEVTGVVASLRGTGSGVIVDSDGYIITNAHVVEGARQVQVLLAIPREGSSEFRSILKPMGEVVAAQIIGTDAETDLAILKIEKTGLPRLELGDSDELSQGEIVLAFGSPLGLNNSVSMGVVSSVARQLRPEDPVVYIQTDAMINPGNSGGPLVSVEGHVMGINASILSQSGGNEGIGFAVPSNIVSNVYRQIRKNGRVHRGEIGVVAQTITPTLASGLKLSQQWGVILSDVIPGGTAEIAGLQAHDIVLTVNGKVMENARQFEVNLYQHSIGDTITLELLRGSQRLTRVAGLNERPDEPYQFANLVNREAEFLPLLGIFAVDINDLVTEIVPLRDTSGVFVAALGGDAISPGIGFMPADVIHSINQSNVSNMAGLRAVMAALKPGDAVVARVERQGRYVLVAFTMPA